MSKKILIIGNNIKVNSIEMSYSRAFESLGNEVKTVSLLKDVITNNFTSRLLGRNNLLDKVCDLFIDYKTLITLAKESNFDLIIIFKCWYLSSEFVELLSITTKIYNFTTDHPLNNNSFRKLITRNKVSSYDGIISFSENLKPVWYQLGAKNYFSIHFASDIKFRKEISKNISFGWTYFGTWGPLIETILTNINKKDLLVLGPGWHKASYSFQSNHEINPKNISDIDMYEVSNKCLGVLNFTRSEHGCFHTMKTFEIPNSGNFYISNRSKEQEMYFKNHESALFFDSYSEIKDLMISCENGNINTDLLKKNASINSKNETYDMRVTELLKKIYA
jgi:hypothetical protein|tara:strand:- start:591 stop:1592 length:1002 start_codon:yes stop_codon:yes gene_type:complete